MPKRFYVTTAIDYPNAAPHLGHVLEKVTADVLARWLRLSKGSESVRFQIGTDEHGIKIQQKAQTEGLTPAELVDRNVPLFTSLYGQLNVSADLFIRTSDRPVDWPNVDTFDHKKTVQELWKKLAEAGMLEKRTYTGLYCTGCERFVTAKDLVDGKCPDHNAAPQEVKEENWFYRLKDDQDNLLSLLTKKWDGDGYRIVPPYREAETLSLLEQGLEDVSFSRPKSSLSWGIPVPGDEEQTMYVWCDALTNYISGIGLLTDAEQPEWWSKDTTVTHVIGKDIARFHALIWPSMLKHAGLRAPDQLLIHGFVTNEGQKMSKSLGNVVNPVDVLARFNGNPDPMRFFLLHQIPVGRDGDFSWKRLEEMYDAVLRNQLGNLLNRVIVMLKKEGGTLADTVAPIDGWEADWESYASAMDDLEFHRGIEQVVKKVAELNEHITKVQPWKSETEEKVAVLCSLAEALRHVSLQLLPFMPDTASRISQQLNVPYAEEMKKKDFAITDDLKRWGGAKGWTQVGEPAILFVPLDEK